MSLTFNKFFEEYQNYHSFTDLLNLCKEVSDYVYNNDITHSQLFDKFIEGKNGYIILFNKPEKTNYIVYSDKKKVTDDKGVEVLLDRAYEDIENLYNDLRNNEYLVNIRQIDEQNSTRDELDPYGEEDWNEDLSKNLDPMATFMENTFNELGITFRYDPAEDIYFCQKNNIDMKIFHIPQTAFNVYYKINNPKDPMNMWNSDEFKTFDLVGSLTEILNIEKQNEKMKTFKEIIPDEPLNEAFEDELRGKLSEKYISLKRGILELLDDELGGDITKLQSYIDDFVDPESEAVLDGFVEDADIFDFYLKYQSDIDQILLDRRYYDDAPEVESLYDYVIDGTFDAVVYCMEEMKKELYSE